MTAPFDRRELLSLPQFKALARKGAAAPAHAVVAKALPSEVQPVDGARRAKFTISTGSVDRDNDTIKQDGWVLDSFRRNPVVLFQHASCSPPIGKVVELALDGDALKAVVEFLPEDVPIHGPVAEMVWRMVKGGFLSATSVGFRPLAYTVNKERMGEDDWFPPLDFERQELMELSIVTIPANGDCIREDDAPGRADQEAAAEPGALKDALAAQAEADAAAEQEAAEQEVAERAAQIKRARADRQRRARLLAVA